MNARCVYFDEALQRAVKERGFGQVLSLGAGLCTRVVRLDLGVPWFEVDIAKFLQPKARVLGPMLKKNTLYRAVELDYLATDPVSTLLGEGLDPCLDTVIQWEGNCYYLDKIKAISMIKNTVTQ